MSWTNDTILEFIDLYKRERVLWDPKHPQHRNREEVSEAWMRINSCFDVNCSVVDLKRKKESLMTSFRFHWNRKRKNPNYRTSWFAYTALEAFLSGKYECDSTNELENEFFNNTEANRYLQGNADPISCRKSSSLEKSNTNKQPRLKSNKCSVKKQADESTIYFKDVNEEDGQNINDDGDLYDLYGKLLVKKLRKFDEHQRDVIMHEIDNILFRAKMQEGSSQSKCTTLSTSPVPHKIKSPIFIVTEQNQSQYEDENVSYAGDIPTQQST